MVREELTLMALHGASLGRVAAPMVHRAKKDAPQVGNKAYVSRVRM